MNTPRRVAGIDIRYVPTGQAEIVAGTGEVLGIVNAIAAAALELCDGTTTLEEMTVAATDVFDVDPTTARDDLARALVDLARMGAITSQK